MLEQLKEVIEAVKANKYSFCKFISANDAGETGAHQSGLYIPKNSIPLMFDTPGIKGSNKEKFATIKWSDGIESNCRFIYYGQGTRNEYRITRLGKTFKVDDFVVIIKVNEEKYLGYVFFDEKIINSFLKEFEISREDTNNLIFTSIDKLDNFKFKPRAKIIQVIGQELISNDVIALVELIKNSYDADSTEIEIELNNIFHDSGEIIIKDNGLGMSYEKVTTVWLEPATPDKKSKGNPKYSYCFQRRLLGEKGIGRFAAHRLGDNIELSTRARSSCDSKPFDYETKVKINWNSFTEEKYLDEVPINVTKNDQPKVFSNSSGTLIKISNIHPWKNIKAVKDAVLKIKGLESPVSPKKIKHHKEENSVDPGIKIHITSDDIKLNKELSELKSLSDVLQTAFYKFNALVDADGKILYTYSFDRVDYQDIKRGSENDEPMFDSLLNYNVDWFEEHPLNERTTPGSFEISFFAWDLDTSALKVAGLSDYYKNIIKPNTGVRVYRDNFRVWPYGEQDNDWLEMDLARLNSPKERSVSRNQVFGIIHLSSINNPMLKDQSNREGLIVNEQYEQFYSLVNAALSLFAKERKVDKLKIDTVSKVKRPSDIVTESIDKLRSQMENNNHVTLYKQQVDKIQESYHEKINDVLERYMMAAAIGISYSIPIHEMKLRLTSIKHVIEDIERNAILEDKYLRELSKQLNDTEDIIKAVSSIMSRQKLQKVNLFKIANNAKVLKEFDLIKHGIEIEIDGNKNIEVEVVPGLVNTAVLNIVDNAIYWLRSKKLELRQNREIFQPLIKINIGIDNEKRPTMTIKDNGNGFTDPFELLIEPYYSRKTDGLGLGLYLVNEIMIRNNGRLSGYNEEGAVFVLTF